MHIPKQERSHCAFSLASEATREGRRTKAFTLIALCTNELRPAGEEVKAKNENRLTRARGLALDARAPAAQSGNEKTCTCRLTLQALLLGNSIPKYAHQLIKTGLTRSISEIISDLCSVVSFIVLCLIRFFATNIRTFELTHVLEMVLEKCPVLLEILSQVTRPRNETRNAMTSYGKTDLLLQEAADGFCAWFILQYRRGYKPFVRMMRKEIKIEGGV